MSKVINKAKLKIYNPDRSTFTQSYANTEYTVKPGISEFPEVIAKHLVESLKMWGVVLYKDDSDIARAKELHAKSLERHYTEILAAHAKKHKDALQAGLPVPESEDVRAAKEYFAAKVSG